MVASTLLAALGITYDALLTTNRYGWPEKHLEYMVVRATDHGARRIAILTMLFKWARNKIERPGCELIASPDYEISCRLTFSF